MFAGFLLASSYSLIVNYKTFGKASLVPLYNLKYEIFYLNFFRWKYPEVEFKGEIPEYGQVIQSYWNTPIAGKAGHSEKYKQMLLARLPSEWSIFLSNLAMNVVWLWDKDHIYTYVDKFYPADQWPMRILNIGLIGLWAIGVIGEIRKKGKKCSKSRYFFFYSSIFLHHALVSFIIQREPPHARVLSHFESLGGERGSVCFVIPAQAGIQSKINMDNFLKKIYLYSFLNGFNLIFPIFTLLFSKHGLNTVEISLLIAIWSVTTIVFEVPAGVLADKYSRRNLLA